MRKLQNTLYITTQGSYLHKERETLVVEQSVRRWRSCRCIPSGIFSVLGMCWCRRFYWGFAVKIM